MLLDYAATYPNAIIHYKDSNMVLHMDSDAAYITMLEARSCYDGNFYLSDYTSPKSMKPNPKRNSPIHIECKTVRNVVSSATEAETCGTFNNGKTAIGMRIPLITSDHKQAATPLKTDNSMIEGFVNSGMKPKRSKKWEMKWHWLRDKEVLEKLIVHWYRGNNNGTDYYTKHHPPIHHHQMRPRCIHTSNLVRTISPTTRSCEGVLNQVPGTQYRVDYLSEIRAEPQSMIEKCHTFRRLNLPRQHMM